MLSGLLFVFDIIAIDVEMMGFLGTGNNPMVGMTVSVAVAVEESLKK